MKKRDENLNFNKFLFSSERISNAVMESRAIAKAPEGQGCPRCGGYVYAAEQMLARGRVSILSARFHFHPDSQHLDATTFFSPKF